MKNTIIEIADRIGTWIKGDDYDIHVFEANIKNNIYSFTINTHENAVVWIGRHCKNDPTDHEKITTIFTGEAHVQQDPKNEDIFWINLNEQIPTRKKIKTTPHIIRCEFDDKMYVNIYNVVSEEEIIPLFAFERDI